MKRLFPGVLLCCLLFVPGLALAQGQGWSVLAGDTVGSGRNVFYAQAAFPGLSLNILHGMSDKVDLGGRFAFNYAQEGVVDAIDPGLKLQMLVRLELAKSKLNFGLEFEPGVAFYFHGRNNTWIGMLMPVNLVVGIPASSALMLNAGIDMPIQVYFGKTAVIPILFGGGLEYFIDQRLNVNFNLKMGPSIFTEGGGAEFTLESQIGVAYAF